jgi:hypothetical protein
MKNFLVFVLLLTAGCGSVFQGQRYSYRYSLTRPASDSMSFSDSSIKVKFIIGEKSVRAILRNISSHTIEISWEETVFVLNGFVKESYQERSFYGLDDYPYSAASMEPGAVSDVLIWPSQNLIHLAGPSNRSLQARPLLPIHDRHDSELRQQILDKKGKSFSLLLPVRTGQITNDYIFEFTVTDVVPQR